MNAKVVKDKQNFKTLMVTKLYKIIQNKAIIMISIFSSIFLKSYNI